MYPMNKQCGHPSWPGIFDFGDPPKKLNTQIFKFDLTPSDEHVWIAKRKDEPQYSSQSLAKYIVGFCIEQSGKSRDR